MSESRVFRLGRLYYGTLVDSQGRTSGTPGAIAHTPEIGPVQINECLRMGKILPPAPDEISDDMPGALGLFRGDTTDFILVKAQRNDAGHPQMLYILVPAAPLSWLGGNVLAFRSLAMMDMPSFTAIKKTLQLFELRDPAPASADEQADALLDLLQFCQDSFKHVEGLLAGLIHGLPLAIINSPSSMDQRLRFLQGLLSLLPLPARVGITFVTHARDALTSPAQVKFFSQHIEPANHAIYDWANNKLLSTPPDDSYSRYMLAQFRLDASLVVEQTAMLSRTTAWRASHKENLSRALSWVSRRAAIDQSVRDGQPVDIKTVADILREDPTLPDDLRLVYTRHLLAFALALGDHLSADIVPALAVSSDEIAKSVEEQLNTAIDGGQSWGVYTLLERWLLHVPEGSEYHWQPVLHHAARQHLAGLLAKGETQPAMDFLAYLQAAPASLKIESAVNDLIAAAQTAAHSSAELARMLFLLAIKTLPPGELYRLLGDEQLTRQLPEPTQTALLYLQIEPRHPAPPHVLDMGARPYGDGHSMLVLTRFVEWAMYLSRPELVDTAGLQALLIMAQSPQAERYATLIEHVVEDFSQISIIQVLDPPGPRVLVQLLLQTHRFAQAMALLEFYQNVVLRPERLADFTQLAGDVFLMTRLLPEHITEALKQLEGTQIRPEPRAMIYCSALMNREWAGDQDYAAKRLTTMIFNDNNLIAVVGRENALKLLFFHSQQKNPLDALRVGAALVDHTLSMGTQGAALITQMWPAITWNSEVSEAALELLRRYIRSVPPKEAPMLLGYFGKELEPALGLALQATYLMRQVMGSSGLLRFADDVHLTAQLFVDIATTYHTGKELPPIHRLRRDLDTMPGGLSEQERKQVAENTLRITHQVFELGREVTQKRSRPMTDDSFVQGKIVPQNGMDLLRFMGGRLAQAPLVPLNLGRETMSHIFGSRSAAMFLRETEAITRLLDGLQLAFESTSEYAITPEVLSAELDSLWSSLSLYNQRRIQDQFAQDCLHLAEVIGVISGRANERVLSDSSIGRQLETGQRQPQTALEALRWIHGYFARKHIRTRT